MASRLVVLLAALSATVTVAPVSALGAASSGRPVATTAQVRHAGSQQAGAASPARALKRLASRHNAKSTAGPARRHGHLFGAYSVVGSEYCCRPPHDRLRLLRWRRGAWVSDGLLRAHEESVGGRDSWNFPDYGLYAERIRSASRAAPVFGGPVNATYPSAHMLAVRQGGWHWARFIECRRLAGCAHPTARSAVVLNPRVAHHRLTSRVSSCKPDCGAPHQVVHVIRFAWRASRRAFVEVGVHRTRT